MPYTILSILCGLDNFLLQNEKNYLKKVFFLLHGIQILELKTKQKRMKPQYLPKHLLTLCLIC